MGRFVCEGRAGRVSCWSIAVCCAIVAVTVWFVAPVFLPGHYCPQNSPCQSNLKQIGSAIKMYLAEWHDTYPINRGFLSNGKLGHIVSHVKLTRPEKLRPDSTGARYRYGVNWVEALIPYISEMIYHDSWAAWHCEKAGSQTFPRNSNTAEVSYAFNRNLAGRPERAVRTASNLMMVREMDRLVDAELRPTNYSCGLPDVPPDSPFLTTRDSRIGRTSARPHYNGSNVLFADGHVKGFSTELLPAKPRWDSKDRQWFNCIDPSKRAQCKSIAITP